MSEYNTLGYILSRALPAIKAIAPPHVHLFDLNGSMYMGRWSVVDEFKRVNGRDTKTRTMASKVLEKLTGYTSIRLHWIRRADHDRDMHNHPFNYRSFVLKGCYAEEYDEPGSGMAEGVPVHQYGRKQGYRWVHRGGTVTGSEDKFHRIDIVPEEGVWTLFCMTRNTNLWGFAHNGTFIRSARYFRMRGYNKTHRSDGKVGA
jgi:hypothetical protein